MSLFGLNRRRSETLILAIAQLVLIAYVFQFAAFDHWHFDGIAGVKGVEGSSVHAIHAEHCHGSGSTCAEGGGGFAHFMPDGSFKLPSASPALIARDLSGGVLLHSATIEAIPQPPRA